MAMVTIAMLIGDMHVLSNMKFNDSYCYGNCYYGNIAMAMVTIAMLIGDMHVLSNVKFDDSCCYGNCHHGKCCLVIS